jgi:hypothetical protein
MPSKACSSAGLGAPDGAAAAGLQRACKPSPLTGAAGKPSTARATVSSPTLLSHGAGDSPVGPAAVTGGGPSPPLPPPVSPPASASALGTVSS